jgi:hypothetical protein
MADRQCASPQIHRRRRLRECPFPEIFLISGRRRRDSRETADGCHSCGQPRSFRSSVIGARLPSGLTARAPACAPRSPRTRAGDGGDPSAPRRAHAGDQRCQLGGQARPGSLAGRARLSSEVTAVRVLPDPLRIKREKSISGKEAFARASAPVNLWRGALAICHRHLRLSIDSSGESTCSPDPAPPPRAPRPAPRAPRPAPGPHSPSANRVTRTSRHPHLPSPASPVTRTSCTSRHPHLPSPAPPVTRTSRHPHLPSPASPVTRTSCTSRHPHLPSPAPPVTRTSRRPHLPSPAPPVTRTSRHPHIPSAAHPASRHRAPRAPVPPRTRAPVPPRPRAPAPPRTRAAPSLHPHPAPSRLAPDQLASSPSPARRALTGGGRVTASAS